MYQLIGSVCSIQILCPSRCELSDNKNYESVVIAINGQCLSAALRTKVISHDVVVEQQVVPDRIAFGFFGESIDHRR